jgi:predicted RNA-binding protein with PUA domain
MNKKYETELVYWCKTCELVATVKNKTNTCIFCQGELKEMGWVEK